MICNTCGTFQLQPEYDFCTICGMRQPKAKLLMQFPNEQAYKEHKVREINQAVHQRLPNTFIRKGEEGVVYLYHRPIPGEVNIH